MKQKRIIALGLIFMFLMNFMPLSKVYATGEDTLKIGVYSQDGVIYQGVDVEFVQGDTPYSALTRVVGNVSATGSGASVYVSSINGIAEFDDGPLSGWVYAVNGVKPDVSAGGYSLSPGDKLVWHYTLDLGGDIYKGIEKLDAYIAANPPVVEKPTPPIEEKPTPTPEEEKPSDEASKPNRNESSSNSADKPNENISNKPGEESSSDKNESNKDSEVEGKEVVEDENDKNNDNGETTLSKDEINKAIEAVVTSAKKSYENEVNSVWEAIALAKLGGEVEKNYVTSLISEIKENKGIYNKVTDLEKNIILLNILGYDVTDIQGINLLEILLTSDVEKQGANGVIFAIICLNSIDSQVLEKFWNSNETKEEVLTYEELIEILLAYQKEDGGFSLIKNKDVDIDITSMALQALGGSKNILNEQDHVDSNNLDKAIVKAIDYLKKVKFKNSESIAQIIIGCSYVGENPEDFGGVNLIEALLKYKKENNTFGHIIDSDGDNDEMSTEQGVLALISYNDYKNSKDYLYAGDAKLNNVQVAAEAQEGNNIVKISIIGLIFILCIVGGFLVYKKSKKSFGEK